MPLGESGREDVSPGKGGRAGGEQLTLLIHLVPAEGMNPS